MKNSLIFILTLISLFGCKKPEERKCWKSHGTIIEEIRMPVDFNSIEINDHINLDLIPDTINSIKITAGENLMGLIDTEVENGVLIITDLNKCDWVRSFKKEIHMEVRFKELSSLTSSNTADIHFLDTLRTNTFQFNSIFSSGDLYLPVVADSVLVFMQPGPTNLYLSGRTQYGYFYNSGTGFLFCRDLKCKVAHGHNAGIGDFFLHAENVLTAEIRSRGNIYYTGNPSSIYPVLTSSGQLISE